jgi:hypothetical protein
MGGRGGGCCHSGCRLKIPLPRELRDRLRYIIRSWYTDPAIRRDLPTDGPYQQVPHPPKLAVHARNTPLSVGIQVN